MTKEELKNLLLELIVGTQTAEWRAYPRQNITMNDFDSLLMLMSEAAIAQVSKPIESTSSSGDTENAAPCDGLDVEQFIAFAETEPHIQSLVDVLIEAGSRIHNNTMAMPEDQTSYYE